MLASSYGLPIGIDAIQIQQPNFLAFVSYVSLSLSLSDKNDHIRYITDTLKCACMDTIAACILVNIYFY